MSSRGAKRRGDLVFLRQFSASDGFAALLAMTWTEVFGSGRFVLRHHEMNPRLDAFAQKEKEGIRG
jgi:hypothetical protein